MKDFDLKNIPARFDLSKIGQEPNAKDLEEMPATKTEDWSDAVVIEPLPIDLAQALEARKRA